MTRKNPGARIADPRIDWEWNPLRLGETERICVGCGKPYDPAGEWHTVESHDGKFVLWWIACGECYEKRRRERMCAENR